MATNQPGRLYSIFKNIASSVGGPLPEGLTGDTLVDEVIRTLAVPDLARLLSFVCSWNSNAKTSGVAQRILFAIVKLRSAHGLMRVFDDEITIKPFDMDNTDETSPTANPGMTAMKELIEAIIPYTERHLSKVDRLLQESYLIDYILGEMDDGMFDADGTDQGMEVEVY